MLIMTNKTAEDIRKGVILPFLSHSGQSRAYINQVHLKLVETQNRLLVSLVQVVVTHRVALIESFSSCSVRIQMTYPVFCGRRFLIGYLKVLRTLKATLGLAVLS
uniref:Uncharacterized protein n=1 Tax=Opuntia streptacantha TaxID=393608 RepID=A0A7C9F164_OPUST